MFFIINKINNSFIIYYFIKYSLRNCFSCFIPQNSIFSDSSHYEKRENTVNNSRIESVNEMMRTSEVFQFNSNMPDPDLMAALEEKKRSEIAHTKRSLMSMQQRVIYIYIFLNIILLYK